MNEKMQFLLRSCFYGEIRKHSYKISDFTDDNGREIISTAKSIGDYINIDDVISKIKKECFDTHFKYENYNDKRVLSFLIKHLSDFQNFDFGATQNRGYYDDRYCLKYQGQDLKKSLDCEKITGVKESNNYVFVFTENVLYH